MPEQSAVNFVKKNYYSKMLTNHACQCETKAPNPNTVTDPLSNKMSWAYYDWLGAQIPVITQLKRYDLPHS